LGAVSMLVVFWERYVPIPILALAGLVLTEMHHLQARDTE